MWRIFMRSAQTVFMFLVVAGALAAAGDQPVMTASDVLALPRPAADLRVPYGLDPFQFGELRLPDGPGPHPVAIVVHGGCWLAEYDLGYISSLAAALTAEGIATWSIEYRRVGDPGGGWPGTFTDVAAAADHLAELAGEHPLALDRVVAVGHSAGGHLALWLAGRQHLGVKDPLRGSEPLPLIGVVTLAGIPDLAAYAAPTGCGATVSGLLGDNPPAVPDRLRRASPIEMVPLGIPQTLVVGELDVIVPREQADRFVAVSSETSDRVAVREIMGAGHFELVVPEGEAWSTIRDSVRELLSR
jgi:acetyl esterase/lipase